jgi:hypothetical protein
MYRFYYFSHVILQEKIKFLYNVIFVNFLHLLCFRINSTILAKTAKNKRKAEKKRKAIERRVSEGDANPVLVSKGALTRSSSSLDANEESYDDSGLASSFEEAVILGSDGGASGGEKAKLKRKTKKRSKQFEMSSDLIFDLDI